MTSPLPLSDAPATIVARLTTRSALEREPGLAALVSRAGFTAGLGQIHVLPAQDGGPPALLVGAGEDERPDAEAARRMGLALAQALRDGDVLALDSHAAPAVDLAVLVEALVVGLQGSGRTAALTGDSSGLSASTLQSAVIRGQAIATAVQWVETPPNRKRPRALADAMAAWAVTLGAKVTLHDTAALEAMGAGALLAIGAGSPEGPVLLHLRAGDHSRPRPDAVLVGKGITYDSGGLSLKGADDLMSMKSDMAGAAACVAAAVAAAQEAPHLRVDAVVALAENMPSGTATRPGDVVTSLSGQTIEILNTDFEGRVVLADALTYATRLEPGLIVDVATLTESIRLALGLQIGGLFTEDDDLAARLLESSRRTGEPLWRMPSDGRYDEQLASELADLRNFPGSRHGRSITAMRFLARFVTPGIPWAHLDIAGPAWRDLGPGRRSATGFSVALLTDAISRTQDRTSDTP